MKEQLEIIAERIRGLRELEGVTEQEMAVLLDISAEDYQAYESGARDFSFTFLYTVAGKLGVDITELLTGDVPKLRLCSLVRNGEGLPIERRRGFAYQHMAYMFRDKAADPFRVTAKFDREYDASEIALSRHDGQEYDMVLKGSLKFVLEGREMLLNEGDAVYYDARHGHGMAAAGGADCEFLAVVIKTDAGK